MIVQVLVGRFRAGAAREQRAAAAGGAAEEAPGTGTVYFL